MVKRVDLNYGYHPPKQQSEVISSFIQDLVPSYSNFSHHQIKHLQKARYTVLRQEFIASVSSEVSRHLHEQGIELIELQKVNPERAKKIVTDICKVMKLDSKFADLLSLEEQNLSLQSKISELQRDIDKRNKKIESIRKDIEDKTRRYSTPKYVSTELDQRVLNSLKEKLKKSIEKIEDLNKEQIENKKTIEENKQQMQLLREGNTLRTELYGKEKGIHRPMIQVSSFIEDYFAIRKTNLDTFLIGRLSNIKEQLEDLKESGVKLDRHAKRIAQILETWDVTGSLGAGSLMIDMIVEELKRTTANIGNQDDLIELLEKFKARQEIPGVFRGGAAVQDRYIRALLEVEAGKVEVNILKNFSKNPKSQEVLKEVLKEVTAEKMVLYEAEKKALEQELVKIIEQSSQTPITRTETLAEEEAGKVRTIKKLKVEGGVKYSTGEVIEINLAIMKLAEKYAAELKEIEITTQQLIDQNIISPKLLAIKEGKDFVKIYITKRDICNNLTEVLSKNLEKHVAHGASGDRNFIQLFNSIIDLVDKGVIKLDFPEITGKKPDQIQRDVFSAVVQNFVSGVSGKYSINKDALKALNSPEGQQFIKQAATSNEKIIKATTETLSAYKVDKLSLLKLHNALIAKVNETKQLHEDDLKSWEIADKKITDLSKKTEHLKFKPKNFSYDAEVSRIVDRAFISQSLLRSSDGIEFAINHMTNLKLTSEINSMMQKHFKMNELQGAVTKKDFVRINNQIFEIFDKDFARSFQDDVQLRSALDCVAQHFMSGKPGKPHMSRDQIKVLKSHDGKAFIRNFADNPTMHQDISDALQKYKLTKEQFVKLHNQIAETVLLAKELDPNLNVTKYAEDMLAASQQTHWFSKPSIKMREFGEKVAEMKEDVTTSKQTRSRGEKAQQAEERKKEEQMTYIDAMMEIAGFIKNENVSEYSDVADKVLKVFSNLQSGLAINQYDEQGNPIISNGYPILNIAATDQAYAKALEIIAYNFIEKEPPPTITPKSEKIMNSAIGHTFINNYVVEPELHKQVTEKLGGYYAELSKEDFYKLHNAVILTLTNEISKDQALNVTAKLDDMLGNKEKVDKLLEDISSKEYKGTVVKGILKPEGTKKPKGGIRFVDNVDEPRERSHQERMDKRKERAASREIVRID